MVTAKKTIRRTNSEYLEEVKQLILARHPDAEFDIIRRRRNEITMDVLTDGEMLRTHRIVAGRTTDILVESGLHIVVVPLKRRRNSN